MTIIAYKDGVLAADTQLEANRVRSLGAKKIIKTKDGWLAGGNGQYSCINAFLTWADGERDTDELTGFDWENFQGVMISPEGKIYCYDDEFPYEHHGVFYASGIGSEIATGAFAMGATAKEAVKAAIDYHTGCGGKIVSLKL